MIQVFRKTIVWDLLFLAILTAVSLFLISFYFNAQFLEPGYSDWIVHAFRIKFLSTYGLSSWTHIWSNGISLWKAYQFVPHFLTLALIKGLHVDITRGMILMTIILFVLLRIEVYILLRLLKFNPITCFICSLLTFAIAQYWDGVASYSLLFGFTFFPIAIYLWIQHLNNRLKYTFSYFVGLLFYIHIILGFYSFLLWIASVLFSDRKVLSLRNAIEFFIISTTSSIIWYPLFVKHSYVYSNSWFNTTYFLNLVIAKFESYGFGLFIIVSLLMCLVSVLIPRGKEYKWTVILTLYSLIGFVLVIVGINLPIPSILSRVQYTRGVTILAIAIVFAFAPVAKSIIGVKNYAFRALFLFVFCLSLIESLWFISIYAPQPRTKYSDSVYGYSTAHKVNLTDGRIWTSNIGGSSYFAPLDYRFPYSYMDHLDSNQVVARLSPIINYRAYDDEVPLASLERVNDYFKITGTKYAFFTEMSPFTNSLQKSSTSNYKDLGIIELPYLVDHAFQTPWEIRNSVLVNDKYANAFAHFPFDLEFTSANDQTALDDHVHRFVDVLYKPENTALKVTYPTQETVQIEVPDKRTSKLIYLNESYDANWKAYFNNRLQKIEPSGPNYMLITLDSLEKGTLVLRHTWPLSFYVSVFLIILIPCEMLLMKSISYMFAKKKHVAS